MNNIEHAILLRNARFRAWRDYGVPINRGWMLREGDNAPYFAGYCALCGPPQRCQVYIKELMERIPSLLESAERQEMKEYAERFGCPHLAPLLGEDPPEVRAIYELELLAGG